MTNEEKLAEIRQDLECLCRLGMDPSFTSEDESDALVRAIARLESDLARLTAPRGKTERRTVVIWEESRWPEACLLPSGQSKPNGTISPDVVCYVTFDMPLREVPVVEGEIA